MGKALLWFVIVVSSTDEPLLTRLAPSRAECERVAARYNQDRTDRAVGPILAMLGRLPSSTQSEVPDLSGTAAVCASGNVVLRKR